MKRSLIIGFITLLAAIPFSAFSHHSFVSQFDPEKLEVMTGRVVSVRWVNPHAFFDLMVENEAGTEERWSFELGSPNTLIRYGWYRDTLEQDEIITVEGYLARSGANLANAKTVTLADGTIIQAGSSYDLQN